MAAGLDQSWRNAVAGLTKLAAERARAVGIARKLGSEHPPVAAIPFTPRQLAHENAGQLGHTPAYANVADVLDLPAQLGDPIPEQPPEPQRIPGPDLGRLVFEDVSANSPKVQAFVEQAEARKREQATAA